MAADWSDSFDSLERQLAPYLGWLPYQLTTACRLAIVAGREAARKAEEAQAEAAMLRGRLREQQAASPTAPAAPSSHAPVGPVVSLLRHGDAVLIGPENARIPGVVYGVMIGGPDYAVVKYLVAWWDDRISRQEWIEALGVEASDDTAPRAAIAYGGITHGR